MDYIVRIGRVSAIDFVHDPPRIENCFKEIYSTVHHEQFFEVIIFRFLLYDISVSSISKSKLSIEIIFPYIIFIFRDQNFVQSPWKFYRSKVLFILFSKCKWMAFLQEESRIEAIDQCSFILFFQDQNFVQSRLKLLIEIISILFCVFEVETLRYFLLFCLFQVKIYLLCRLFRLKLLIEFLNFICFCLLWPENFHYLEVILFILFYFSLFSILFSSFLRIFNNIKNHSLKFYSAFLRSKLLMSNISFFIYFTLLTCFYYFLFFIFPTFSRIFENPGNNSFLLAML